MYRSLNDVSVAFAAGAIGTAVNSAALLAASRYGLLHHLHIALSPPFSLNWIYSRLIWGGLWAPLLILSFGPRRPIGRGLTWSLAPSLFQLLWVFPHKAHLGLLGISARQLTPLIVLTMLILNGIWGVDAAYWSRSARC